MKWTTEAQKWADEGGVGEAERAEAERLAAARGKDEVGLREAQAAVGKREMAKNFAEAGLAWMEYEGKVSEMMRKTLE